MVRRTAKITLGAASLIGTMLMSSTASPLQAQIIDNDYDPTDEAISLPEGDEAANEPLLYYERDDGSVGAVRLYTAAQYLIIIDGQVYEYNPNDLDNNPILDNLVPLGSVTPNAEVNATPGTSTDDGLTPEPPAVPRQGDADMIENGDMIENDNVEAETDSGGMVTYPPADGVEELEPEDILE